MNQVSSFFRGLAAKASSAAAVGRVLFCAVALVLATGSAGAVPVAQVEAASQAGAGVAERFHFNLVHPDRLCVGGSYDLKLTMLVDLQIPTGGSADQYQNRVVPGINIEAKVDDTSVASISPASKSAGVIETDLLIPPSVGNANGLGQVDFALHGKREGATTLTFKATIPGALTGGAPQVVPMGGPITVQNCKYKITVYGSWSVHYPNLLTRMAETLQGEITRDENDVLSGAANVAWELRSASVMCSHSHSITLGQAQLSGNQGDFDVNVTINYDAFELVTVNCGSGTQGQVQVAPLKVAMPTTGGAIGKVVPFPVGNEQLAGTATIIIVPIPIQ